MNEFCGKEIPWFTIGASYGGNQDWMRDPWMKIGGCAALAAVDTCLVLTQNQNLKGLCPECVFPLSKDSYIAFGMRMKPYLHPRFSGIDRLEVYTDGFQRYLQKKGITELHMEEMKMGIPLENAKQAIQTQIDAGLPVPMLHLRPKCAAAEEYEWHWFMLTGYRITNGKFQVKATTYGSFEFLDLEDLWHETDPNNGGIILYRFS